MPETGDLGRFFFVCLGLWGGGEREGVVVLVSLMGHFSYF